MATQLEIAQQRKISRLKEELHQLQVCLATKNRQLDAMHWAWCSGGCASGMDRWTPTPLTEELLQIAERGVGRMRSWLHNAEFKKVWAQMSAQQKNEWMENAMAKKEATA